jgi:hypothetical protein
MIMTRQSTLSDKLFWWETDISKAIFWILIPVGLISLAASLGAIGWLVFGLIIWFANFTLELFLNGEMSPITRIPYHMKRDLLFVLPGVGNKYRLQAVEEFDLNNSVQSREQLAEMMYPTGLAGIATYLWTHVVLPFGPVTVYWILT